MMLTTSELSFYYFQYHCSSTKFPLSSCSPLNIPSILFKKESFPVEFVLYADAPCYAVPFPTSMKV